MEEEKNQNVSDPAGGEMMDLAGKSLADALRLSFRLLSFFMIFVLVLFLLTGLSQIQPNERGIRLLFGKIRGDGTARVLGEGLAWSLPEPIGRVIKIPTGERKLEIDDFWLYETPEEALVPLSKRLVPSKGLRPGWDGALLTGDRALVHVKFTCNYRIGFKGDSPDATTVIDYVSNVIEPDEIVRSAVCNAAIRVAATLTVDKILKAGKVTGPKATAEHPDEKMDEFSEFSGAVKEIGQNRLDAMQSGIRISSVKIESRIPPLAARAAFVAVNTARQEKDTLRDHALREANTILADAVGDAWKDLVEDPAGSVGTRRKPLLKLYAMAREAGDKTMSDKLFEEINQLLVSNKTKGQASEIIEDARRYNTNIRQSVEAREKTFKELLPEFNIAPKLMTTRLWADVKENILNSKIIAKYYLAPGQKFVIRLGKDPKVTRRINEELLKIPKGPQTQGRPGQQRPR
ncbi:MAG: hypothetical protein K8R91_04555 [Phycisphaerae bacterium]|nr:hypothetical protein [Phycisphaerae bacterium]